MLCKIVAVLLVLLWPAVTSHSLLTHSGIIHVVHSDHAHDDHDHHEDEGSHEHNGDNHAFADGDYRPASKGKLVVKPSLAAAFNLIASVVALCEQRDLLGHSPGPGWSTPWSSRCS